jgi:hypothetical protein
MSFKRGFSVSSGLAGFAVALISSIPSIGFSLNLAKPALGVSHDINSSQY